MYVLASGTGLALTTLPVMIPAGLAAAVASASTNGLSPQGTGASAAAASESSIPVGV